MDINALLCLRRKGLGPKEKILGVPGLPLNVHIRRKKNDLVYI
jgi:hypothetical protein